MRIPNQSLRGFTLIEIAVVLFIASLLSVGALQMLSAQRVNAGATNTRQNAESIVSLLRVYLVRHNRLPCPADPTLAKTHINFAVSTFPCPASLEKGTTGVFMGSIPAESLGIESRVISDGWDNQFMYAVVETATLVNSWNTEPWC